MQFDFPSDRRAEKYPLIAMYDDTANDFINWLNEHKEIDRRVPPIYQDFRITHKAGGNEYRIFAHYNDDSTAFEFRMKMDGKTIIQGASDYNLYDGDHVHVSAHARDKYTEEWIRNTALAAALLIISVQAYMLYFKPEIVEKIYNPSAPAKSRAGNRKSRVEPVRIRSSKIKRIYLTSSDKPDRTINYRKLSWWVRGHYRHVGKEKKLKYIQPFTCSRGGKETKIKRAVYRVESPGK